MIEVGHVGSIRLKSPAIDSKSIMSRSGALHSHRLLPFALYPTTSTHRCPSTVIGASAYLVLIIGMPPASRISAITEQSRSRLYGSTFTRFGWMPTNRPSGKSIAPLRDNSASPRSCKRRNLYPCVLDTSCSTRRGIGRSSAVRDCVASCPSVSCRLSP